MEEYLNDVLSQIRCKKAHPYIAEEMRGHIEDQISDNMEAGMERDEAEKMAVLDMGDPIEVGISMDRIHKPKVNWGMLGVVIFISILSVALHYFINIDFYRVLDQKGSGPVSAYVQSNRAYMISTGLSILAMFMVYFMDYTFIAKHARKIACIMIAIVIVSAWFGTPVNGRVLVLGMGAFRFSLTSFVMLYIPIWGALLVQYRGQGMNGILKAYCWMMPMFLATCIVRDLFAGAFAFGAALLMLTIAVLDNWFTVSKKKFLGMLWGYILLAPVAVLLLITRSSSMPAYRMARINAWLHRADAGGYLYSVLVDNLRYSRWIGNNGTNMVDVLPSFSQDFIFSYIVASYGICIGIAVVLLLTVLVVMMFHSAFKMRNKVGMMMGCGCAMIIGLSLVINICENVGLLPLSQTFLPFFSQGGSNQVMCYLVLGMMLSIYRYKDVYQKSTIENRMSRKETLLSKKWEEIMKSLEIDVETDTTE